MSLLAFCLSGCRAKTNSSSEVKTTYVKPKVPQIEKKTAPINTTVINNLDDQDKKIMNKISPRTVERMDRGEPLTINDIIKLSQGGISDDTIIRYIKETKTTYNLSQAQINRLQEAGASQRVVNFMIDTGK